MKGSIGSKVLCIVVVSSFYGCATIFKGYEDKVSVTHLPSNTKIYTQENIELPILNTTKSKRYVKPSGGVFDSLVIVDHYILLRSNTDHILTLKNQDEEKRFHLYPRLSAGWFILDVITGTFFIDLYTGNWNHFNDIDYKFSK